MRDNIDMFSFTKVLIKVDKNVILQFKFVNNAKKSYRKLEMLCSKRKKYKAMP